MEPAPAMKIRMVRPFRVYRTGDVIPDAPDGMARYWIANGLAVEEKQQDLVEQLETATAEPVVERADATPRKRRK
jgi:hypothetical protein